MQIETNKDMPMDISIMLNCADIDKLIRLSEAAAYPIALSATVLSMSDIFRTNKTPPPGISFLPLQT